MATESNAIVTIIARCNEIKMTILLRVLICLGGFALLFYLSWWVRVPARLISPGLAVALLLAALYNWAQLLGSWALYLKAVRRPTLPLRSHHLGVDVFVTACKEPFPVVERSLSAACNMRGTHRTWLLDDGNDPVLAALARRLGAGYLTRSERVDAKAGNINAALKQTGGEIIVIFDVDHAPEPDFLERTLGFFADPKIGFVQVMLTFRNREESWVARAAQESSLDYYNPTCMGADGMDAATLIGSNALIRRSALASIGGYYPGLAEDLATSVRLHAAGWRSVYVAEPLAPGLAPVDLTGWFSQQLKWARGVFEVGLVDFPRLFPKLNWGQRLSYSVRGSYYWIGLVSVIHLAFTIAMLFGGDRVARLDFLQYLTHVFPLAATTIFIRQAAILTWRHPSTPILPLWRAMALVYATWPVYTLAWILAVLRVPIGYRPTPKQSSGRLNPLWILPQFLALLALISGIIFFLYSGSRTSSSILLAFASLQTLSLIILLRQALYEWYIPRFEQAPA